MQTSDGPRVRLCEQHAERDRLAADLAEARRQVDSLRVFNDCPLTRRGLRALENAGAKVSALEADLAAKVAEVTEARQSGYYQGVRESGAAAQRERADRLEADLAAKTAALERAARNLHEAAGLFEETPRRDMAQFVHGSSAEARAALDSSPGAAWLAWAREAYKMLAALECGPGTQGHALLARAPDGMKG